MGVAERRVLLLSGARADVGAYGLDRLDELGYDVRQVDEPRSRLGVKCRDVMDHRIGYTVSRLLRSASVIGRADFVLAIFESEAIAASSLRSRGVLRKPVVVLICWLVDELRRMTASERERSLARFAGVDLFITLSRSQIDELESYGVRRDRLAAIPFGCAPELFPVSDRRDPGRVVAIGVDRGRDFRTLVDGVRGTAIQVDLYTLPAVAANLDLPSNVTYRGMVPFDEYRQVVANAGVVAVPTHVTAYPTGQSVALEAAASGAAVAVTRTPAMCEYFSEEQAAFVEYGDPDGWRRELTRLLSDERRRQGLGARAAVHVRENFTYDHMWRAFDEVVTERLGL